MSADAILVIDAGTSALRAVAVTARGDPALIAREPWQVLIPDDAAPYGREVRPGHVTAALGRLLDAAAHSKRSFSCVAFTGQREGLVFADERGQALLISPNVDARAAAEGIATDAQAAGAVYERTGHLPSLMQAPAKLAWLRLHRPEAAGRVRYAVPLADWLASTVTGEIVASTSLLVENGMLDVRSLAPLQDVLDGALVPLRRDEGQCVGSVRQGRLSGASVVLCGGDTQCALLGSGALEPGDAGVVAGWSAPVQVVTREPRHDPQMRTWTGVHVIPDRWLVESNAGEAGRAWQWMLSMLGITTDEAATLVAASPAASRDVMTVLGPARMDAKAMNAGVGGVTFPLPLVMSSPERADVLRSVLEATAYAIRANLEQAEEVAGTRAPSLRLAGGMARSEPFAHVLAHVVDRPVYVASTPETSSLGAAVLAARAAGFEGTLSGAVAAMVRPARIVKPSPDIAAMYDDCFHRWLAMSEAFGNMA